MSVKAAGAKPHILVEALAARNDSGLGRHVRLFCEVMASLSDSFQFTVLLTHNTDFRCPEPVNVMWVKPNSMKLWIELALPIWILRINPHAVFHLGYTIPCFPSNIPKWLLVPDAGPLESTSLRMSRNVSANRKALLRQIPKATQIVTSTDFTRDRLQHLFQISPQKISVLPPIHRSLIPKVVVATQVSYELPQLPSSYFLAVGNVEPRKNYPGLLRAYADLKLRCKAAPALVIVGHKAWGQDSVDQAKVDLGLSQGVIYLGHLSDAALAKVMQDALVFVSASLYEGFGLPLFEALSLGCACIMHPGGAQASYALGLALEADAENPSALSQAMELLWLNQGERENWQKRARAGMEKVLSFDLKLQMQKMLFRFCPPQSV